MHYSIQNTTCWAKRLQRGLYVVRFFFFFFLPVFWRVMRTSQDGLSEGSQCMGELCVVQRRLG